MRRLSSRSLRLGFATTALALSSTLPGVAVAQSRSNQVPLRPDGEPQLPSARKRQGFALFGLADQAYSALKTSGKYNWTLSNYGSMDFGSGSGFTADGTPGGAASSYINFDFAWGAPPSQRAKIIAANASNPNIGGLSGSVGGGFTVAYRSESNGRDRLLAADNQLGPIHSGIQSTSDNSCRDHRGKTFELGPGNPLLAGSDCPVTWGTLGWQGRKPIPGSVYLAKALSTPGTFTFDFWRYPEGNPDGSGKLDRQFGTFQAYGSYNDYSKDDLCGGSTGRTYGNMARAFKNGLGAACPSGAPNKPGYPLGLEVRTDGFAFGIPALADVVFYQFTIANNSAFVYGNGVDYDSLYIGPMPTVYSETQRNLVYHRPELNTIINTGVCSHQTPPVCNGAVQVADLKVGDVTTLGAGFPPFGLGASAFIILKSPLGDTRNKLFSRPSSPFFALRGTVNPNLLKDTITFNHGHLCGFRACSRTTWATSDLLADHMQRMFGMISSTEKNVLGTRAITDLQNSNNQILWHTFRSADWPAAPTNIGTGPSDFPQSGGFNRYVPGVASFDYNHDGIADTLFFDTCSSKTGGSSLATACVGLFSDTMPHTGGPDRRFLGGYSNTGGIGTVGPIKLKAGDTTSFVIAMTSACCFANGDSIALITKVNAAIDHYLNFYLGPEPLPRDTIKVNAVEVIGGNKGVAQVTLRFTKTAETSTDAFLLNLVSKYRAALRDTTGNGTLSFNADQRLVKLNRALIDSLASSGQAFGSTVKIVQKSLTKADTTFALSNFDQIYVFKSCDGGNTFTNSANCTPSPATGGPFASLGFLPYDKLQRDPNTGLVPSTYTDPNVNGGTSYTYVLIGATKGVSLTVLNGDKVGIGTIVGTDTTFICTLNCRAETIAFAPQLFNQLATSGPNAITVYVPASLQAGAQSPIFTVTTVAGPAPSSRLIVTSASSQPVPGTYTVSFYDSVIVVQRDTVGPDGKTILNSKSIVTGYRGGTAFTDSTQTGLGGIGLSGGALVSETPAVAPSGSKYGRIRTFRFAGLTAIIVNASQNNKPILVTSNFNSSATPEAFFSSAAFPGFNVAFDASPDLAFNTARGEVFVGPDGKVVKPLVVPYVRVATASVVVNAANAKGGEYDITWKDKPFGPGEVFRLSTSRDSTIAAVNASLTARVVAQTGIATSAAATAVGIAGGDASQLVAVKLPFTITNASFGNRVVNVVMKKRASNTILLGNGQDTLTVPIPADVWVPGDQLFLLEDTDGNPATPDVATFTNFSLACPTSIGLRPSCNPLALLTRGATTYITTQPGTVESVLYNPKLTTTQQFSFVVTPQATGAQLAAACTGGAGGAGVPDSVSCKALTSNIKNVRAVPNPYIVFSQYQNPRNPGDIFRPMLFTHVPARGNIRIYTVSGQFMQQLSWTEADLNDTGDLIYDLRTREGNLIAGGLYLFVVTGTDTNGKSLGSHMGKFVIIR